MENVNIKIGGGLSTLLTVAFIVLKLLEVITWKWVWVLAPFWGPYALIIGLLILFLLFMAISYIVAWLNDIINNNF